MAASSSSAAPADPADAASSTITKANYCLQCALAAKEAGNAALQRGNLRGASFEYKKVYLHLAEYLPADVPSPAALANATTGNSSSGAGENNGLVQLLQQRRSSNTSTGAGAGVAASAAHLRATKEKEEKLRQVMLQLYATTLNNLSFVALKLGRYRAGVNYASAVLDRPALRAALDEASPSYARDAPSYATDLTTSPGGKARLRRASCYVKLGEWTLAEADLKTLLAADEENRSRLVDGSLAEKEVAPPQDPALGQLGLAIEQLRKAEAAQQVKLFKGMFAREKE